jgi:hypothetical protein
MGSLNHSKLVNGWIAYAKSFDGREFNRELFWSWSELSNLVAANPESAWEIIVEIFHASSELDVLQLLASGPLEELLARHGDRLIARIERMATESRAFNDLVSAVWKNAITDKVWARLRTAVEAKYAD